MLSHTENIEVKQKTQCVIFQIVCKMDFTWENVTHSQNPV